MKYRDKIIYNTAPLPCHKDWTPIRKTISTSPSVDGADSQRGGRCGFAATHPTESETGSSPNPAIVDSVGEKSAEPPTLAISGENSGGNNVPVSSMVLPSVDSQPILPKTKDWWVDNINVILFLSGSKFTYTEKLYKQNLWKKKSYLKILKL